MCKGWHGIEAVVLKAFDSFLGQGTVLLPESDAKTNHLEDQTSSKPV